ncbi:MAG TPA: 5'/3'-nucleotidase SurE [Chromatiaceae bacterium]|nr:5'/3'-nucleotidase SurE [Chromatiaceae bacterium]
MRILLSNDDGYLAPGLKALADGVAGLADITVVAPDRDRSGASNSLTLENPLRVRLMDNGFYKVNGTPTDCVHVAITGLLDREPDMVISGINLGANLGDDVLYSGTVAAATEGRFLGYPAIAISIDSFTPSHLQTAARVAADLLAQVQQRPLDRQTILNVNVPDIPWEALRGFRSTRLGHRHKAEPAVRSTDPRGETLYWVGPPGPEQDAGEGTDFHALRNHCVSVTPLRADLTHAAALPSLQSWLEAWA